MTDRPILALAGATGDLGGRIARALIERGATVRALVRPDLAARPRATLTTMGVELAEASPDDQGALARALGGVACVVSALNGLRDVIVERQGVLLDAAVSAGVPRFIPSDYSSDFTRTRPGDNRNFDLRREFMARVERAPIQATSILNGAFMDMLGAEMPLIQPRLHRVLYWHDADQPLDFTTKDDVAAYVAAAALDASAPRWLRIAGDVVSVRDLARVMTEVTGTRHRTLWAGSLGMLSTMIAVAKVVAPGVDEPFPPWQGMQYMRDQFSGRGKLSTLDNDRYPGLTWTAVRSLLARRFGRSLTGPPSSPGLDAAPGVRVGGQGRAGLAPGRVVRMESAAQEGPCHALHERDARRVLIGGLPGVVARDAAEHVLAAEQREQRPAARAQVVRVGEPVGSAHGQG